MARKGPNQAIASVLRQFRQDAGLTQEALASGAKMTRNFVGMVERGERRITADAVDRWLYAVGASWTAFGAALDAAGYPRRPTAALQKPPAPRKKR